jgi:hypothetical protein
VVLIAILYSVVILAAGSNEMRIILLNLILFLLTSCFSQNTEVDKIQDFDPPVSNYRDSYTDFKSTLTTLYFLGRLDDTSDRLFWKLPLTQELYTRSSELMPFYLRLWHDPTVSREVKSFSGSLAQCLSKKERLIMIDKVFSEYKNGTLSDDIVTTFLSPGSEWSSWLDLNYADIEVENTLNRILIDPKSSKKIIETIKLILDGTGADFIREYGTDVSQKLICVYDQPGSQ